MVDECAEFGAVSASAARPLELLFLIIILMMFRTSNSAMLRVRAMGDIRSQLCSRDEDLDIQRNIIVETQSYLLPYF